MKNIGIGFLVFWIFLSSTALADVIVIVNKDVDEVPVGKCPAGKHPAHFAR